jgi:phosphopantothenoylcysteine decarboxylase/phosphopantothenate--cysteine ligase
VDFFLMAMSVGDSSIDLVGKRILLGVTGGIAAYKAAELLRLLKGAGADVHVVMTRAAKDFVGELTFQALSGHPVHSSLLNPEEESAMSHIALAKWPDLIVIAPASANFLARLTAGLADDLLSAVCLATSAPVYLVPAMNAEMWNKTITQRNLSDLRSRAYQVIGPDSGPQACGDVGFGRMSSPEAILEKIVLGITRNQILQGIQVLVTAGPTQEPIDPVRYVSNRSSGKMGYAIAEAAAGLGAEVTLVTGPTAIPVPRVFKTIAVRTAAEMFEAVMVEIARQKIFIGVAAVADYSPRPEAHKIKKGTSEATLILQATRDILAEVAAMPLPPFTVGFAAETESLERYAQTKLENKAIDMIAANQVGEGLGFESDVNALHVYWRGGQCQLAEAPKAELANRLVKLIAKNFHEKGTT